MYDQLHGAFVRIWTAVVIASGSRTRLAHIEDL
jgi:hypothetical protein